MSEESEKSDGVGCELMYSGNGAAGYNANNGRFTFITLQRDMVDPGQGTQYSW